MSKRQTEGRVGNKDPGDNGGAKQRQDRMTWEAKNKEDQDGITR